VHPNLIAALADDRRTFCLCGVVPSQPHQLCRRCFTRIGRPSRSFGRHRVNRCARAWVRSFAAAASTLRVVSKRARS